MEVQLRMEWLAVTDPPVCKRICRLGPFLWRVLQQAADEVLGIIGDQLPARAAERIVATLYARKQGLVLLTTERQPSTQEEVGHNAATPEVRRMVVVPAQHLRSDETDGAAGLLEELVRRADTGEAEVRELHNVTLQGAIVSQQSVLRLDVTVHNVLRMHVRDTLKHLPQQQGRMQLREHLRVEQKVYKLSSGAQLHDQVQVVLVLECVEKPHNMLLACMVTEHLHDLYLLAQALRVPSPGPAQALVEVRLLSVRVRDPLALPRDRFDRSQCARPDVRHLPHAPERTISQLGLDTVHCSDVAGAVGDGRVFRISTLGHCNALHAQCRDQQ
mmetsp:Transcript_29831/g.75916  ORF Transcript_29831/g.75916 Transcript_29831/m.75916 type:complete len:330 (+) Transcript_29831:1384-2373(+)